MFENAASIPEFNPQTGADSRRINVSAWRTRKAMHDAVHPISDAHPMTQMLITGLDRAFMRFSDEGADSGLDALISHLNTMHQELPEEVWRTQVRGSCVAHPIFALLMEDPLSRYGFVQPRSYAGDPIFLDMILDQVPAPLGGVETSARGLRIFNFLTKLPLCTTVRERRQRLANRLDALCLAGETQEILMLNSGHLSEAKLSNALMSRRFSRCSAVEDDPQALAYLQKNYASLGVTALKASTLDVVAGTVELGTFDVIASASLLENLDSGTASTVLTALFRVLRPGGRMLLSNLDPINPETSYFEVYARWKPHYRSPKKLEELCQGLGSAAQININDSGLCNDLEIAKIA